MEKKNGKTKKRCQCPDETPVWNGTYCVKADDCEEIVEPEICPKNCRTYYDGCNGLYPFFFVSK